MSDRTTLFGRECYICGQDKTFIFLEFTTGYDWSDKPYTAALLEDKDGAVWIVKAEEITFIDAF